MHRVIPLCSDVRALEVTVLQLLLLCACILSMSGDAREMVFEIPFLRKSKSIFVTNDPRCLTMVATPSRPIEAREAPAGNDRRGGPAVATSSGARSKTSDVSKRLAQPTRADEYHGQRNPDPGFSILL